VGDIMAGSETVMATNGVPLPLSVLAKTLTYSGSFIATQVVVYDGLTYTQTYTNNGTQITHISQWVAS
jgi:hypothetical protein